MNYEMTQVVRRVNAYFEISRKDLSFAEGLVRVGVWSSTRRRPHLLDALLPSGVIRRSAPMSEILESLQRKMEAAAHALDFEEAKRCRDRISLIRGGATATEAEQADFSDLVRQEPGAMGLGTSQQRASPPPDWRPPPKPDPMTSGRTRRGPRRK